MGLDVGDQVDDRSGVVGADRVRASVGDAVDDRLAGERDYIDLAPLNAIEVNVGPGGITR